MGETRKCTLKPFTAAKSSDAVAGGDGPVTRFPVKRKTVAGFSCEEVLQEAKLPAADKQGVDLSAAVSVPGRKHRLSDEEIRTIIALRPEPLRIPDTDYLDDLADAFSPEYIKERKEQLIAEAELWNKMAEEGEVFRQQVIKSVLDNGYFEVDDEFLINREKVNQMSYEHWAEQDRSELRFATEAEMLYTSYVPDNDDGAVLISY